MKNFISVLFLCLISACGKNSSPVFTNETATPPYEYVRPFAMSTNEKLLDQNSIIHFVDLREVIPNFDMLPITQESYQQIYNLLKVDQNLYSKYTVLKKTADCQALVGYCHAYYIRR